MKHVVIYTKSWCGYCTRAKILLARKGASFEEIEISGDPSLRDEMVQKAHGQTTVPQIFIGGAHIGGCDDLHTLEREGKLDALLG
ncbi:glutaredoxin 3 [Paludisphaera mucosa]|uniref:Glutaredoxin n=1 Tax=Paludisphaera mucosa TaxID=3030827 RepID=A0ABT6F469_9BACT|nr:glutaredoxin 3 [Paludisphaera mucosa]MDG3002233.1 glutaredoxin 3 [Paludisphaera mucosa]